MSSQVSAGAARDAARERITEAREALNAYRIAAQVTLLLEHPDEPERVRSLVGEARRVVTSIDRDLAYLERLVAPAEEYNHDHDDERVGGDVLLFPARSVS